MSTIRRVVTRYLQYDMGDKLWNSQQRWSKKPIVLAFVETDDGTTGVGEAWVGGASPEALIRTIEDDIAPALIGREPYYHARFWADAYLGTALSARRGLTSAALGAVDTALWDLVGKLTATPLYKLLGAYDDAVYCYGSAGLYGRDKGPEQLADEMRSFIDKGFDAVKLKVGGVPLADDVKRVAAARAAIGGAARLMVDANYTLNVPEALALARAFAPYNVYWLEAPVNPDDVAGQARVNLLSPIPVCGNETEHGRERFRMLAEQRAVEYLQFDIAACGGVTEGRRIAALAAAHRLPVTLHASSSAVVFAASLHLAASLDNLDSVEYHMLHQWLFERMPAGAFAVADGGRVRPPGSAGIGVDIHYDDL